MPKTEPLTKPLRQNCAGASQEDEHEGGETDGGGEISGTHGGADDTLLPPASWFPFFVIFVSLGFAITFSKWLEKKDTPGGAYGVVEH